MLSINTNISSLIAQSSMKTSSQLLNQAVERMSTGYKINHAKDNAANYSISTNMTTKIGAYMVAEDNVLSGMDLINTATEVIEMMEDRASRLSALSIQARNGTYGAQSLAALNAEAGALVSEIMRLYNSTQFNSVNLFNRSSFTLDENLPQAGESGFIQEPVATYAMRSVTPEAPTAKAEYGGFIEDPKNPKGDAYVEALTSVSDAVLAGTLTSNGEYKIGDVDDLKALASYVNGGNDTSGMTFIMSKDIDLSGEANWTPIGTSTNQFKGEFDGNGHKIANLTVSATNAQRGLFGCITSSEIKNVVIKGGSVKGSWESVGGLVGSSVDSNIVNCYTNLSVSGVNNVGGLVGNSSGSNIDNCYALGNVSSSSRNCGGLIGYMSGSIVCNSYAECFVSTTGDLYTGGLVGRAGSSSIINCYATKDVKGAGQVGGLVGLIDSNTSEVINSFATGDVKGTSSTGGLIGSASSITISNSYATGNVTGNSDTGGLIGFNRYNTINNSYATGAVNGTEKVGGFAGYNDSARVDNCYSTGNVTGSASSVGGFIGSAQWGNTISNSYATGSVLGVDNVGGFIGAAGVTLDNCYSEGSVEGEDNVGGFVGSTGNSFTSCYSTSQVKGESFVGGFIGQVTKTSYSLGYTECHAYGNVSGTEGIGGLIGGAVLTTNGTTFGKINLIDCQAAKQSADAIGGVYQYDSATSTYTLLNSYDSSGMVAGVKEFTVTPTRTSLLLGINGNDSDQITFDTNFVFDFSPMHSSVDSEEFSQSVNLFVKQLQEKTTILGAVQNRLESALDEISIKYENLVSSRSTIRDADISEVSSTYIQQQILQQAAATLMSTANQSPAIALQLV